MRRIEDLSREELEGIVRVAHKQMYYEADLKTYVRDLDVNGGDLVDAIGAALHECDLTPQLTRWEAENPAAVEAGPPPLDEVDAVFETDAEAAVCQKSATGHEADSSTLAKADPEQDVFDVWCKHCGRSGSLVLLLDPTDINW